MKIIELGIEILDINEDGEYPVIIFDKILFSEKFLFFYKAIDSEGYRKISELMVDIPNAEDLVLKAVLEEEAELTISKIEFDKLLRIVRKDKMKKLKLI